MTTLLSTITSLVEHRAWADASLLNAIGRHPPAASDREIHTLVHHMLSAQRFWLRQSRELSFNAEEEVIVPGSLSVTAARFRETHTEENVWLATLTEADLARVRESSFFPSRSIPVIEGLLQAVLHSQGHRSQCLALLRASGGTPPALDFILWAEKRPAPRWE
jgi:uncharacterized damage-inducible protein DinB